MPRPEKSAQDPFTCTIASALVVDGFCGLSEGRGTGTLVGQGLGDRWPPADHRVEVHMDRDRRDGDAAGQLVVRRRPEPAPAFIDGEVLIAFVTVPVAGSCTNKTATDFLVDGEATLTHPKCLPGHATGSPCDGL
jgi:hypothetical protein